MLPYPQIDPVIFSIGPLAIRWYGLMYLLGFLTAYLLGRYFARRPWTALQEGEVEDLIFYGALGAVLGGRAGYVFFYGFEQFLGDPLWLLRVWEGGMSFHGGLLGVFLALILYGRKIKQPLPAICDFVAPLAPLGLGFGRLANFINAELYGRQTDLPWAMVFPTDPMALPRHPSQLYQFMLEGVVLFMLLWFYARKPRPAWSVTGMFLLGYGAARFFVEFYRQPDAALAFDWMTRGQLLSLPMLLAGLAMLALGMFKFSNRTAFMPGTGAGSRAATEGKKSDSTQRRPSQRKAKGKKRKHNKKR